MSSSSPPDAFDDFFGSVVSHGRNLVPDDAFCITGVPKRQKLEQEGAPPEAESPSPLVTIEKLILVQSPFENAEGAGDDGSSNKCSLREAGKFEIEDCKTRAKYTVHGVLPFQFHPDLVRTSCKLRLAPKLSSRYKAVYTLEHIDFHVVKPTLSNASNLLNVIRNLYDAEDDGSFYEMSGVVRDSKKAWEDCIKRMSDMRRSAPDMSAEHVMKAVLGCTWDNFTFFDWVRGTGAYWAAELFRCPALIPYWVLSKFPTMLRYFPLVALEEMTVEGWVEFGTSVAQSPELWSHFYSPIRLQARPVSIPFHPISWTHVCSTWPAPQVASWVEEAFRNTKEDDPQLWLLSSVMFDLMQQDLFCSEGHTKHRMRSEGSGKWSVNFFCTAGSGGYVGTNVGRWRKCQDAIAPLIAAVLYQTPCPRWESSNTSAYVKWLVDHGALTLEPFTSSGSFALVAYRHQFIRETMEKFAEFYVSHSDPPTSMSGPEDTADVPESELRYVLPAPPNYDAKQRVANYFMEHYASVMVDGNGGSGKTYLNHKIKGRNETKVEVPTRDLSDEQLVSQYGPDALENRPGIEEKHPMSTTVQRAQILRSAPYNAQMNDLIVYFGMAYTHAKLIRKAMLDPAGFRLKYALVHTVVWDECALMDEWTFCVFLNLALNCLPNLRRILLFADKFQLRPIQGGQPFIDLLHVLSYCVKNVHLDLCHRVLEACLALFEVVKAINKGETGWIHSLLSQDADAVLRKFPHNLLGWECNDPQRPSWAMIRELAQTIFENPTKVQIIAHSHNVVNFVNRLIMSHRDWFQPEDISCDFPRYNAAAHNNMRLKQAPYSTLYMDERVVLLKKKKIKYTSLLVRKYPFLRALVATYDKETPEKLSITLPKNSLYMVRDFTVNGRSLSAEQNSSFMPAHSTNQADPPMMWIQRIDCSGNAENVRENWIPLRWHPKLVRIFTPSYVATTDMIQGKQFPLVVVLTEGTFTRCRLTTAVGRAEERVWFMNVVAAKHHIQRTVSDQLVHIVNNADPSRLTILQSVLPAVAVKIASFSPST